MFQQEKWSDVQKLEYDLGLHGELSRNYDMVTKLAIVICRKGLQMILENPWSEQHYLTRYWCIKSKIIDTDRRSNGDWWKKPTQYWFIGTEPKNNVIFEPIQYVESKKEVDIGWKTANKDRARERSEIHPQYANRFIKKYLIDYEQDFSKLFKG